MVIWNSKKQKIIQLVRLLKRIKLERLMNAQAYRRRINMNNSTTNIRLEMEKLRQKNLALRNYYLDIFIQNKKIEMLDIHKKINNIKETPQPVVSETPAEDIVAKEIETETTVAIIPKILVIIATHINNSLRLKSLTTIMNFLSNVPNIDIIIVNSTQTGFADIIKKSFSDKYLKYFEIKNDNYFGFSKWYYGIVTTNLTDYKFVTFINDSILIHSDITHFFDYTRLKDVDLYGYNDSSQMGYHYQTYLFSIKVTALHNFIRMLNENTKFVKTYMDAVRYYEVNLPNYFTNRDCFLKIAHFPSQKNKNIFHNNDFLYLKLKNNGLLPFSKLKRIL